MKSILVFTLLTGIFSQGALAGCPKLPEVLAKGLEERSVKTGARIMGYKMVDRISDDRRYKEAVVTDHDLLSAKLGIAGAILGAPHSFVGTMAFSTSSTSGNPYDEAALALGHYWANMVDKFGGPGYALSGTAASLGGVALMSYAFNKDKNPVDKVYLLNTDKLSNYVADAAERLASMFSLSKDQEAALRTALREAIVADSKKPADQRKPVSAYEVARNAKYAGKDLMSPENKAVLEQLEKDLNSKRYGQPTVPNTDEDKIRYLVLGTAMIESFRTPAEKTHQGHDFIKIENEKIALANRKLVEEIVAFRKANCTKDSAAGESDEKAVNGSAE